MCNHSCLDHICIKTTESKMENINAGVIQTHITDHFYVFTTIPIFIFENNNSKIYFKNSENYNLLNKILKYKNNGLFCIIDRI